MSFTQNERQALWNHCFGADIDEAQDVHGAIIKRDAEPDTEYAWEIDHIFPASVLENAGVPKDAINNVLNLRILHHSNNESKGNDYPAYAITTTSLDEVTNTLLAQPLQAQVSSDKNGELFELYYNYYFLLATKADAGILRSGEEAAYNFMKAAWDEL